MTGASEIRVIRFMRSNPSTPGNTRSRRMRRGFSLSIRLSTSSGLPVAIREYPASDSTRRRSQSVCWSSSTARMRAPCPARRRNSGGVSVLSSEATGTVKLNRAPRPRPGLSAQIRPPCVSTIPLQMARPRPSPMVFQASSVLLTRENFWNRCGSCSEEIPSPSSATEMTTWASSSDALKLMTDCSGECLEALESRLAKT